jgi:hypothetical protein
MSFGRRIQPRYAFSVRRLKCRNRICNRAVRSKPTGRGGTSDEDKADTPRRQLSIFDFVTLPSET